MKKLLSLALATLATTGALAQQDKPKISVVSDIKFSGYVMSQYQYSDKEANDGTKDINTFNIRMVRMALEGRLMQDFYWKVQLQANGNTSDLGSSPRMVDAFAEWQKFDAFKVKAGQFKRPFTFENPMHPVTQGFMGYSQNVSKLSGFSDRVGEHASNGRDIGVQIQGDIIKNQAGRNLVHYQIGVFNGQGTGQKDVDQRKDVIGGSGAFTSFCADAFTLSMAAHANMANDFLICFLFIVVNVYLSSVRTSRQTQGQTCCSSAC